MRKAFIFLATIGVLGWPSVNKVKPNAPKVITASRIIEITFPIIQNPIAESVLKHSETYDVDPKLIYAIMEVESKKNPTAKSKRGAYGLMQLMPKTAKLLGVNYKTLDGNIEGGTKYISQQLKKYKTVKLALAAYNAGPGNVDKYGRRIPPFRETRNYVKRICDIYEACG